MFNTTVLSLKIFDTRESMGSSPVKMSQAFHDPLLQLFILPLKDYM